MALLTSLGKYKNTGLLLLRIGLGLSFLLLHGYPKLIGGVKTWEAVGGAMAHIGIDAYPAVWGFLAAITEAIGGLLLLMGFLFRPAAILLAITMFVAALNHLMGGDGITVASHAIELILILIALTFIGPGKYSVDKR